MERCFRLSFLARCLLPSVARLFRQWHRLSLSSTSNCCKNKAHHHSNGLYMIQLCLCYGFMWWLYLIDISPELHQQGDGLSHCDSVVDVIALQARLQLWQVSKCWVTGQHSTTVISSSPVNNCLQRRSNPDRGFAFLFRFWCVCFTHWSSSTVNFDGGQRVTSSAQACRAAQCRPGPPGLGVGSVPSLFGYEDMNTLSSRANDLTKSWEGCRGEAQSFRLFRAVGVSNVLLWQLAVAHLSVFSSRHVTAHSQSSGTLMKTDGGPFMFWSCLSKRILTP